MPTREPSISISARIQGHKSGIIALHVRIFSDFLDVTSRSRLKSNSILASKDQLGESSFVDQRLYVQMPFNPGDTSTRPRILKVFQEYPRFCSPAFLWFWDLHPLYFLGVLWYEAFGFE